MNTDQLLEAIVNAIGDAKGLNISVLEVREMTVVTDYMVIVTGNSSRHVKSISRTVVQNLTDARRKPIGLEGEQFAQWILIDYGDVIVHVMDAATREFYSLESIWKVSLKESVAKDAEAGTASMPVN